MQLINILTLATLGASATLKKRTCPPKVSAPPMPSPTFPTITISSLASQGMPMPTASIPSPPGMPMPTVSMPPAPPVSMPPMPTVSMPPPPPISPPPGCASCPIGSSNPDGSFTISSLLPGPNFGKFLCGVPSGSLMDLSFGMTWSETSGSHDFSMDAEFCFFNLVEGKLSLAYTPQVNGVPTSFPVLASSSMEAEAGMSLVEGAGAMNMQCSVDTQRLLCDAGMTLPMPFSGTAMGGYINFGDGLGVSPYCV